MTPKVASSERPVSPSGPGARRVGGGHRASSEAERLWPVLRRTVRRLRAAGIATPRQDAELLLAHLLEATRLALHLSPDRRLEAPVLQELEALVVRREGHEPLQYLLGEAEFLDMRLRVGPGVFIPRPETELLVERAAARCGEGPALGIDLCTGSGAVACALARLCPHLVVWAVERSRDAASWARLNVERLGLGDRVRVLEGDLAGPLPDWAWRRTCDVVVGNPPYIAREGLAALPVEVRDFEPELALDGGAGGLSVIAEIIAVAPVLLRPGGHLLLEVGHQHADLLRARLAEDGRYGPPSFHRDLLGYERVLDVECR